MFPLPIRVRIALGADLTANPSSWSWTDITDYTRKRIAISRGKPDEAGQAPPMSCRLRVNNAGGRFVARNPLGAWYPLLRRNTPLRVEVQVSGVWYIRFTGFIDELPPTFVPGSTDTYVDLVASGVTRRLGQGSAPVASTPVRYIPTTSPVAYWPLEDGQLSSEGAPLVGSQSMRPFVGTHPSGSVISAVRWGRGDLAPWLRGAVSRSGSVGLTAIWSPVNMTSAPARWTVDFMYRSGSSAGNSMIDVNPSYLGGSLGWPQLTLLPEFFGIDVGMNGEPEVTGTMPALFDQQPHHVRWDVLQSGSKVFWVVYVDGVSANTGLTSGNMTLPTISTLSLVADAQTGADMVQGHVAVWTSPPSLADAVAAAFGYRWETAATRMTRLCVEAGVPFTVAGTDSEVMGPQAPAPVLQLLREAETTDGGILFERADGLLTYLRRDDRYNRPVALPLTFGQLAGEFEPTDDDRAVRNDVTVTRPSGRSAQVVDQDHITAQGRYDEQVTINTLTDVPLPHRAGWEVHLGTVDELRYPRLTLNLGNPLVDTDAVAAWLASDIGSRLSVSGAPSELAATVIDQVIEGYSETIDRVGWSATLNCSPASGWDVAEAAGSQRAPADGSATAGLTSSGLSMLLSSTAENVWWTEDPSDFPMDIRVGGERVTASSIERSLVDTFTRTVGAGGWGSPWTVSQGTAADVSVNGSVGLIAVTTIGDERHMTVDLGARTQDLRVWVRVPVTPTGAPINEGILLRYEDANNYIWADAQVDVTSSVTLRLIKRVAGTVTVLASVLTDVVSSTTVDLALRAEVSGGLLRARVWLSTSLEPPAWQASVIDGSLPNGGRAGLIARRMTGNTNGTVSVRFDNVSVQQPQLVTLSARGVNGVQRAWPAGTEVDVWQPAIAAL